MDQPLPPDFKEFLGLLNSEKVEYLIIGGYAVSHYGYPRPTGDLDVWVALEPDTAAKLVRVLNSFGFASAGTSASTFLTPGRIVRMGVPPVRIELLNSISGVDFAPCYARRNVITLDGVPVPLITRADLLANKRAAGRPKDMDDLENLSPP